MNKFLFFTVFLLEISAITAQRKFDNIWKLGYSYDNGKVKQGITLDFRQEPPATTLDSMTVGYSFAMASLCNKDGDLICHSRGFWLEDIKGDTIPGSLNLICHTDERLLALLLNDGSYGGTQSILMLPTPEKENTEFYVFNARDDTLSADYVDDMVYARVEYQKDKVTSVKEKCRAMTKSKKFYSAFLSACRHGNGRDWWIMAIEYNYEKGHLFLFTKDGVVQDNTFDLDVEVVDAISDGVTCFLNDGKKVALYSHYNGLWIYDFDRCKGTVSNLRKIKITGETQETYHNAGRGMANSPDGRFLYLSKPSYLYQFDLNAPDIEKSKTIIVEFDPKIDTNLGIPNAFNQLQLAPNNKIYMSLMAGEAYLHTIEKPNEKGTACEFKRRSQLLPTYHAFALPNYPNFNLGALKGSPCDSIVANKEITEADFHIKVFPNPATTELKIDITLPQYDPQTPTEIRLISAAGAVVKTYSMPDYAYLATLDISDLESGFYEVQLRQKGKTMAVEKVVIVR